MRHMEQDAIEDQSEFLNTVLDSLTYPLYVVDAKTYRILAANQASGLKGQAQMPTCYEYTHGRADPCDGAEHCCPVREVRRTGGPAMVEQTQYDGEGRRRDVELYGFPIFGDAGEVVRIIEYSVDVTERKRAERALRETMAELQRSNADLEHFARVASHDLQSPLIVVAGFVRLLQARYGGQLDDKADLYIGKALAGVERMEALIHAVLAYSRLDATDRAFEPTPCSGVVADALATLQPEIEASGGTVTCDPLPTVRADAAQLAQVFQNLVGNALKFRGVRPPSVHVGVEPKPGRWVFAVRDNGIGIQPEDRERLFAMFGRLHRHDDYPGTGIGLAICKRIVERHGGRIWVVSRPGEGSTFRFSLPMDEPPDQPSA